MSETRDKLRAALLQTRTPTKKVISFFGEQIEIRQPQLKDILAARAEEDREAAIIRTLMLYAYVPGTDEKIFDDADQEQLLTMPFGGDFVAVTQALQELTEVNFLDRNAGSDKTASSSSSTALPGNSASVQTP